jgi:hypothetical protein
VLLDISREHIADVVFNKEVSDEPKKQFLESFKEPLKKG